MEVARAHRPLRARQSILLGVPLARVVAALTVGVAGLIHLALIREHFEEQLAYGLIFTALAVFQLGLAMLLVARPGPRVYEVGRVGSGLIALVYVATRLVPPPGSSAPEVVTALGIAATALELVAVVLLALALPDHPVMRARVSPVWWGVGSGLLSAPLWLVAKGTLQWTSADLGAPFFHWYGQRSPITPALAGSPLPHIWLFAPWWTLLSAGALGVLVGLDLRLSTRLLLAGRMSCRQRRVGLLALVPASLAGPVCCGAPLVALLGLPTVLSLALAPYAAGLSMVLLSAHLLSLRSRWRASQAC
ncbi:MAG TPA: hypothetical protein VF916_14400 [Ktedonobacterales bacterium]